MAQGICAGREAKGRNIAQGDALSSALKKLDFAAYARGPEPFTEAARYAPTYAKTAATAIIGIPKLIAICAAKTALSTDAQPFTDQAYAL